MHERTRARRQALNILYQREITGEPIERILASGTYNDEEGEPSDFSRSLLDGVEVNQDEIDNALSAISEHWSVQRMPLVDRSILRLAAYEILFDDDIPASVSINEAVEMAKVFGGDDSSKFVNGVLGKLAETQGVEDIDVIEGEPEDG